MNSRSSRPRSPTRQITFTDAVVARAIDAEQRRLADARAGEDPQPLAAPARDERVERAHAERSRSLIRGRGPSARAALRLRRAAARRRGSRARRRSGGRGRPAPVPAAASPTGTRNGPPVGSTTGAGARSRCMSPSGISSVAPVAEADHLGRHRRAVAPGRRSCTSSPTSARRPVASITRPIRLATRPRMALQVGLGDRPCVRGQGPVGDGVRHRRARLRPVRRCAPRRGSRRTRPSCAPIRASISPSSVRTTQPPRSTRRSETTSMRLIPPSRAASSAAASRTSSKSAGFTSSTSWSRSVVRRSAPGDDAEHRLGIDRDASRRSTFSAIWNASSTAAASARAR